MVLRFISLYLYRGEDSVAVAIPTKLPRFKERRMPRHTPMDSDPSPINYDVLEAILRPEVTKRRSNLPSTPIMRWLLVAASLSILFFI